MLRIQPNAVTRWLRSIQRFEPPRHTCTPRREGVGQIPDPDDVEVSNRKSVGRFRKDSFEDEEEEENFPPQKKMVYTASIAHLKRRLEQRPVKLWEYGLRGEDLKVRKPTERMVLKG